jgi:hypothetical protein
MFPLDATESLGLNLMKFYRFLLGILFVWRITHLISAEDGPWDLVVSLRRLIGEGFFGELMDCFYCLSIWIAAPLAMYMEEAQRDRMLLFPALSAGAIMLERITSNGDREQQALFFEDKEGHDGMLWKEEGAAPPSEPG